MNTKTAVIIRRIFHPVTGCMEYFIRPSDGREGTNNCLPLLSQARAWKSLGYRLVRAASSVN